MAKQLPAPGQVQHQAKAPQVALGPAGSSSDGSSLAKAVTQQGEALSQLVAHLIAQSETLDLTGNSTSLSAKGTAKREKLQQDLASGNTNFFLQVVQSAHRRLYPALPLPSSVEEAQASGRVSIVSYLERTGGYDRSRELGMMMMLLASIADAFLKGGNHAAREHTALALAATEQAASGLLAEPGGGPLSECFCPQGVERGRKDESVQPLGSCWARRGHFGIYSGDRPFDPAPPRTLLVLCRNRKEPTAKQLPSGGRGFRENPRTKPSNDWLRAGLSCY